jgi:subtilisin family serine protease
MMHMNFKLGRGLAFVLLVAFSVHGHSVETATTEKQKNAPRLLVTFKASAINQIEASLPESIVTPANVSKSSAAHSFLKKHSIRQMEPLVKEHVKKRRSLKKSGKVIAAEINGKYPKRAKRFLGTFNPPDMSRTYALTPDSSNSEHAIEALAISLNSDPHVESVEIEQTYQASFIPNDPYYSRAGSWGQPYEDLWGIKKIEAANAWDWSTGRGVVVAVVDSGIDHTHPDLAANIWTDPIDGVHGADFVSNDWDPSDDNGHGTHVAGIIAATGNNNLGLVGVALESKLMALKGLDATGLGYTGALADSIIWATDRGADVINMSWGGPARSPWIEEAIDYAYQHGVVLVVSAGNSNKDLSNFYPASSRYVITVSAYDVNDKKDPRSNFGQKLDVAAPGVDILSLQATGTTKGTSVAPGYCRLSGTSMASPFVSGVAALILEKHPDYVNEQVRQVIRMTADPVDGPSFNIYSGYGRINARKAVQLPTIPLFAIQSPFTSEALPQQNVVVIGSAGGPDFASYQLSYGAGANPSTFIPIGTPQLRPVTNSSLGVWDTSALAEGPYTLRLTVTTTSNQSYYTEVRPLWMDRTPPVVKIVSPANGGIVYQNEWTQITAEASDNFGIRYVTFFDDVDVTGTSPYWGHTVFMDKPGPKFIKVTAVDIGWHNTSDGIWVDVNPMRPPVITQPTAGSSVGNTITVKGTWILGAFSANITILIDGVPMRTVESAPEWFCDVNTADLTPGTHTLIARANTPFHESSASITIIKDGTPPTIPSSVRFSDATASSLKLFWAASTDNMEVSGYEVDLSTVSDFSVRSTSSYGSWVTGITLNNLQAGKKYYARVRASDTSSNVSPYSVTVEGNTLDITPPSRPSYVYFSNSQSTSLQLNWNPSTDNIDVAGYKVDLSKVSDFSVRTTYSYGSWVTGITLNNLEPSKKYYARVRAYDAAGNMSLNSSTAIGNTLDTTPPTVPGNVNFLTTPENFARLSWTASTDNIEVSGYEMDLSTVSDFSIRSTYSAGSWVRSNTFSNLPAGKKYYARVRAFDARGNMSPYSAIVTITIKDLQAPTSPTAIALSSPAEKSLILSWQASTDNVGISGYRIDVSQAGTFTSYVTNYYNKNVGTVLSTKISGLSPNTVYYARVRAYDAAGNISTNSQTVSGTTARDITSPTLLLAPATGSVVPRLTSIQATVNDNVAIGKVEFYIDGNLASTSLTSPYAYNWNANSLTGSHIVMAKAYDTSGNSISKSSTVTISTNVAAAINVQGGSYLNTAKLYYQKDAMYSGGAAQATTLTIAGTLDPKLYMTARSSTTNFSYAIPLPNRSYTAVLKFAEISSTTGGNTFNVLAENSIVVTNLNVFAVAGKLKAYDVAVPVTVRDGVLNLSFQRVSGQAFVNAIQINR